MYFGCTKCFRAGSIINVGIQTKHDVIFTKEAAGLEFKHIIVKFIETFDVAFFYHVKMFHLAVFSAHYGFILWYIFLL